MPEMTREELDEHIPWEAEHHIPFPKDEVEMDHQVLGKAAGQMEVVLVAAKKEVIADYSLAIREAKLQPAVLDVTAFTIQNAFEVNYSLEPQEAVALINIGATMATINILGNGTSAFTRDVAGGGNDFTEEIQKRLNVSQEEAEAWKLGGTAEGEVVPHEVEGVMEEMADGMAGKLQRSLDFFLSSTADAKLTRIYLCGGTAKVPALQRALEQKSHTPVEILDPFRRIMVDEKRFDPGLPAAARSRGGGGGGPGAPAHGGQVVIRINLIRQKRGAAGRGRPAPPAGHGRRPAGGPGRRGRRRTCTRRGKLDAMVQENARIQTDIDRLKAELGDYDKVKSQREELLKQRKSIQALEAGRTGPVFLLRELSEILTPGKGPTFDRVSYEEALRRDPNVGFNAAWDTRRAWLESYEEQQKKVRIRGAAKSHDDAAEFMKRLNSSVFFNGVRLENTIQSSGSGPVRHITFNLNAEVTY